MKQVHGTHGVKLQEQIDPKKNLWHIRTDVKPYYNEDGDRQGVVYWEEELDHEPTEDDIAALEAAVQAATSES